VSKPLFIKNRALLAVVICFLVSISELFIWNIGDGQCSFSCQMTSSDEYQVQGQGQSNDEYCIFKNRYLLYFIFINFLLPSTIIISCYIAIVIRKADKTSQDNYINKNGILLPISYMLTSVPFYIFMIIDWNSTRLEQG